MEAIHWTTYLAGIPRLSNLVKTWINYDKPPLSKNKHGNWTSTMFEYMRYVFLHAVFFYIVILVLLCIDFSWSRFLGRWSSAFDRLRLMGLVALLMRQPWLCRLHSQLALMASINVAVVACWQLGKGLYNGFAWSFFFVMDFSNFVEI